MALGEREHADVDLRRQLVEQVARSDDLAQQALQYLDALAPRDGTEKDLRRQLAEQVARSEDLIRQVLDYQAALEIADRRTESPETISQ
jgi:SOS response regulatory protein OraA/RecX